ncbi:MAG: Ig-like domain-containing protein [Candidatus Cloacimonetes bacterium]|nr:Ig-like domain-containing protein [Candidatus Cloacimonadota bacterium]
MKYILSILLLVFISILFADAIPPYVVPLYPTGGSSGIPVDSDITFHIFDDADGVDINSVEVNIEGIVYSNGDESFFYSGTPFDYIITVNPPMNFAFDDQIDIQIDASDLEIPANTMTTYSYFFQTIEDLQPPYIGGLDPRAGEVNVPQDTDISFVIYDSGIGVNLTSVVVEIQGVTYTHNNGNFFYSGNANAYQITIDVPVNFDLAEVIEVAIDASDLNGIVMSTFEYSFEIIDDIQPPFTGEWLPSPGAVGIPVDTNISFNIYDNIEGVDITSIIVDVQGVQYNYLNTTFSYLVIPNGYSITIDPNSNFGYGEMVNVEIDAADLSQPANVMSTFSYSFQCIIDIAPPYTGEYDPEPGVQEVPIDSNISFHVYDDALGVDINTLLVDIEGVQYSVANGNLSYSGMSANYLVSINPTENFDFAQIIDIQIDVADLASPANYLSGFAYSFQCVNDQATPYLTDFEPQPYSINNPLNTTISFHVHDDGFGVDINNVTVNVQGINYSLTNGNLFYSGEIDNYLIIVDPVENFSSGDTVYVAINATDLATPANVMGTYSYSFECAIIDTQPPFIWQPFPANGAVNVSINTLISCYILDSGSSVDSTTIEVNVNSQQIEDFTLENVTFMGSSGFIITYQPYVPFQYNEYVTVEITAADLEVIPNVLSDASFFFVCEENQPPTIDLPDSLVCFEDEIIIENFSLYITDPENDEPFLDSTVSNNLDISINGYMVTIQPHLNWNGSENIGFIIRDDQGFMLASDYTIVKVIGVNDPPSFDLDIFPESIIFTENTTKIVDFETAVLDPEQTSSELALSISGNTVINVDISEFIVTFSAPNNWTGSEILTVILDDNVSRITCSEQITVSVIPEIPDEKITVEPHTVDWNDQFCEITIYSQVALDKISGKIFDRKGKLINKLNIQQYGDNKQARWYKNDLDQNLVDGGFYIYQIKINNRIFQGSIIIAR